MAFLDGAERNVEFVAVFDLVDPAVEDPHHAVGDAEHLEVVGGGDDGHSAFPAHLLEQGDDLSAGCGIEVAGWFVGQNYGWIVGQGPGNGHPLLLPAGELRGFMQESFAQADIGQGACGLFRPHGHCACRQRSSAG